MCDPVPMAEASGDTRMAPAGVPAAACRINALPTDILQRAISFLDARQAVQTCVLSRQWRDHWRSMLRISVSRDEFNGMADTEEECVALFKKFVNQFLRRRNPTVLEEFRMRYCIPNGGEDEHADAKLWIRHALQCKARSVQVVNWFDELRPDPMLFASKFLTSLLLWGVYLKPGFFRELQTGCTVLERLTLHACTIADPEISSQTLKVLTIDDNFCTYEGHASISIPSLICLYFFSYDDKIPSLENMESLVTASVEVGYDDIGVDGISQFLRSLSGVRNLKFNFRGNKLEVESNLQWCPNFNNLTTLSLGEWCLDADFYPLTVFLKNSPKVAQLILKLRKKRLHKCGGLSGHLEESLFTCKDLQIVKIFRIGDLEDDPVVNRLEKLLLDNGITSDKIEILDQSSPDSDFSSPDCSSNQ